MYMVTHKALTSWLHYKNDAKNTESCWPGHFCIQFKCSIKLHSQTWLFIMISDTNVEAKLLDAE